MADEREILTWNDFGEGSRELARTVHRSGFEAEVVVAIARGGLLLAGAIAYALDVKSCGALNAEFYTGVDARLDEPIILAPFLDEVSLKGKRVLLVDDVSDSGRTLKMVLGIIQHAGADVRTVCLYSKSHTVLEPDYVWKRTDRWIAFPWSSQEPVTVADPAI
ncbi:MAG: phosphoribosyltransferase [Microbacteriaceae bacterium]|nr:phosphoribosyltransferase [Microbacteriaceae bacterium]